MTREEAISIMSVIVHMLEPQYDTDRIEDAVEMAIKALSEQEPCEDAISRQAAIDGADVIIARDTSGNNDVVKAMTAWKSYVEGLPSVNPQEPKTGYWVELPTHESQSGLPWYECSECNSERCIAVLRDFKYCPNCGAKMAESEE